MIKFIIYGKKILVWNDFEGWQRIGIYDTKLKARIIKSRLTQVYGNRKVFVIEKSQ